MRTIMILLVTISFFGCSEDNDGYFVDEDAAADTDSDSDSDTDPCDGITCQDPPDDECQQNGTLHDYDQEADGFCVEGSCIYQYETVECEFGCTVVESNDDTCFDPCEDYDCIAPLDDVCGTDEYDNDAILHCASSVCIVNEDLQPECEETWVIWESCDTGEECIEVPGEINYCE